jgi:hypothetical protein
MRSLTVTAARRSRGNEIVNTKPPECVAKTGASKQSAEFSASAARYRDESKKCANVQKDRHEGLCR